MLEIGVSTNNEAGNDDIEILNNIKKAGFKNVMLSYKAKNIDYTIKKISDLGLKINYFHLDNKYSNDLWAKGEAVEKYINDVIKQIEMCAKYNIPIAIMHPTWGSPSDFALDPSERGLKNMERILEVAKKNNIKIAIENLDCYSHKHLCYLLDNINDENLGFCYDVGHHHLYNPEIDLLDKYGDRLLATHIHDNLMDWEEGYDYTRDLHLLPFDGKINFLDVTNKLKKIGYDGLIMLEIHKKSCGSPSLYDNDDDIEYLKNAYIRGVKLLEYMEKEFIKPNWQQCNLNISATLAEFLGAPNTNAILPILKKELERGYKNVVFICLDGMGINPIKVNLEETSMLRRNIKQILTSTFPSTTTNATTALTCNKQPLEHGWFGWSLHFEEIGRNLDIYLHSDSQTGERVNYSYPIEDNSNCYFDNVNTDYAINPILPIYVQTKSEDKKIVIENEVDLCNSIREVCARKGKQFIYAYLPEPDSTMHEFGVSSEEAKIKIESINDEIEKLYNDLTDTLIIITADHGQIDVSGYVEFYKDKEINDMLVCTPYLDARTPAFIVKKGKEEEFEKLFMQRYGKDFKLFKSVDLINQGYFGNKGDYGYLLGDYIAIGTYTHKQFISYENMTRFKGHHTSLTEEMEVPLIILKKEKI